MLNKSEQFLTHQSNTQLLWVCSSLQIVKLEEAAVLICEQHQIIRLYQIRLKHLLNKKTNYLLKKIF